jgi:hypothetical protein
MMKITKTSSSNAPGDDAAPVTNSRPAHGARASAILAACVACVTTHSAAFAGDYPVGSNQYTVTFEPAASIFTDLTAPDTSSGRCKISGGLRAAINPLDPQAGPPSNAGTFVARFTPAPGRRFTSGYISYGGAFYTQPYTIVQGSTAYRVLPIAGGSAISGGFGAISFCADYYNHQWFPGFGTPGSNCGPGTSSLSGLLSLPPGGFDFEFDMSLAVFGSGFIRFDAVAFELMTEALPPCACDADFNCDGFLDFTDFDGFVGAFESGATQADFNDDGFIDFTDFDTFVSAFEAGC